MIYENIKLIANKNGRSIRSIEMQAGLGNGVISGWKNSSPTLDNLKAVANVLGVSIEELIKEEVKTG